MSRPPLGPRPQCPNTCSFSAASRRSLSATMAYRRYTLSVLCPVIFMATERRQPLKVAVVRRKSCRMPPGSPALVQASASEVIVKSPAGRWAMFRGVRAGWLFTLFFVAYICLDFSSPFVPGAFEFDPDQSVDGVVRSVSGIHRDSLPAMVPVPGAVRGVEVSLDLRPQPRPRNFPSTEWVVVLREAHSRSSDRSSLVEPH